MRGGDGPAVRLVECAPDEALDRADDELDGCSTHWRPQDVALLTTGSRHPEQAARQARGQDQYWDSFWDEDQAFYGHVLGFKGLERRVVVLALNETRAERSRERLYVGLSRARDQLVVCGDPDFIAEVGGDAVWRTLRKSRAEFERPARRGVTAFYRRVAGEPDDAFSRTVATLMLRRKARRFPRRKLLVSALAPLAVPPSVCRSHCTRALPRTTATSSTWIHGFGRSDCAPPHTTTTGLTSGRARPT